MLDARISEQQCCMEIGTVSKEHVLTALVRSYVNACYRLIFDIIYGICATIILNIIYEICAIILSAKNFKMIERGLHEVPFPCPFSLRC